MNKFEIKSNNNEIDDFEITSFLINSKEEEEVKHQRQLEREEAKHKMAMRKAVLYTMGLMSCLFLIGAAAIGVINNDYSALETVMLFIQAPIAAMIGFYFGKTNVKK
ncbi:MAG: hypothetical protein HRT35_06170 [Algicola sp.]|nr:hypothetical protein [Algicola sp.]